MSIEENREEKDLGDSHLKSVGRTAALAELRSQPDEGDRRQK